eukprot:761489-Hanusia_phi.AAC.2
MSRHFQAQTSDCRDPKDYDTPVEHFRRWVKGGGWRRAQTNLKSRVRCARRTVGGNGDKTWRWQERFDH